MGEYTRRRDDAAALIVCFVEREAEYEAARTLIAGQQLVGSLVRHFALGVPHDVAQPTASLDLVRTALRDAGYAVRDGTPAQRDFEALRCRFGTRALFSLGKQCVEGCPQETEIIVR